MNENREENGFLFSRELPHDILLDELGLDLKDLTSELRAQIRVIDTLYEKALDDGYIDEQEEEELIAKSYKVASAINEKYNKGKDSSGALTVIGGILLLIGAAVGIRNLSD